MRILMPKTGRQLKPREAAKLAITTLLLIHSTILLGCIRKIEMDLVRTPPVIAPTPAPQLPPTVAGNLAQYVDTSFTNFTGQRKNRISEYNLLSGTNNCALPSQSHLLKVSGVIRRFFDAIKELGQGNVLTVSDDFASELTSLKLRPFSLTVAGTLYYGIEELEPHTYGFGILLIKNDYSQLPQKLVIEVPHPMFDSNTPELGGEVLDEIKPAVYLQSGVHRYCSTAAASETYPANHNQIRTDPAHETLTLFHTAHTVVSDPADYVIQLHGFGSGQTSLYEANPPVEVVLSGGTISNVPAALTAIQSGFASQGVNAKVFPLELESLGAQSNIQGGDVRSRLGQKFIHIEARTELRANATERRKIVLSIKNAFP
jgi:hypothetical protein